MKIKKMIWCCIFVLGMTGIHAQEVIPITGGNASGSGGFVNYTIGQLVYNTYTGVNGSVAQGIQQPYEISTVSGIEEVNGITLQYNVYPNPTLDYIILKVENFQLLMLNFQLYDFNGKLLQKHQIDNSETKVSFNGLLPAVYFLKVIQDDKEVKIFKIIKN
jgi:hypothetical protein